mmetsp:Transcript_26224/g.57356  ORF Transcript_26224/g.57356 Transcript_26224/m.57356 type:complete len:134 (+) Transcript_26224:522-923(+)
MHFLAAMGLCQQEELQEFGRLGVEVSQAVSACPLGLVKGRRALKVVPQRGPHGRRLVVCPLEVPHGRSQGQSLNVPLAPKQGLVVLEQLARGLGLFQISVKARSIQRRSISEVWVCSPRPLCMRCGEHTISWR